MGRGRLPPRRPNRSRVMRRSHNIQKVVLRSPLRGSGNQGWKSIITTNRHKLPTYEILTTRVITIPTGPHNIAGVAINFHVDIALSYMDFFKSLDQFNSLFASATLVKIFIKENAKYFPPKPPKLERADTPGPQFQDPSISELYYLHVAIEKETGLIIAISNDPGVIREIAMLDNNLIYKKAMSVNPNIQAEWDRQRLMGSVRINGSFLR
jgi:hypothetical protein